MNRYKRRYFLPQYQNNIYCSFTSLHLSCASRPITRPGQNELEYTSVESRGHGLEITTLAFSEGLFANPVYSVHVMCLMLQTVHSNGFCCLFIACRHVDNAIPIQSVCLSVCSVRHSVWYCVNKCTQSQIIQHPVGGIVLIC